MPINKNSILFDRDLIKSYASKRKNIEERDIRDLFRIILSYLKEELNDEEYKYKIPYVGTLHKKMKPEKNKLRYNGDNILFYQMYVDTLENKDDYITKEDILDKYFKGKTRQEIENIQNEIAEDS